MAEATHSHEETGHEEHGHDHPKNLAHHFDSLQQQYDAGKLGMWAFIAQEILFFSGLFCAYAVWRYNHPDLFKFAHHFLDKTMGAINTCVLLFSSLTMAWGVRNAQLNQQRALQLNLLLTILCGCTFMVVKYFEYSHKYHENLLWGAYYAPSKETIKEAFEEGGGHGHESPGAHEALPPEPPNVRTFFAIYFCMTGLHGIHVLVGIGLLIWLLIRARQGAFGPDNFARVDFIGLYWHIVDLIWIFLFPLLYLIH
jgi:cytochrome c oxidase subunit 3